MAATDYNTRGPSSVFATVANLLTGVGPLDTVLPYTMMRTANGDQRVIGEGIMIGGEIVRLEAFSESTITVARGCADTIPATHAAGTPMWFYEDATGSDRNSFAANRTIGVKVRPQTVGGAPLPVESSPPNKLVFNFRFARPYPPGNVRVNNRPWFSEITISDDQPTLSLSWAHRDRVMQADQLVAHSAGNIGPEPGTRYRVQLRSAATDQLLKEYAALDATSFDYPRATIAADAGIAPGETKACYLLLNSIRESMVSLQSYRIDFSIEAAGGTPPDPAGSRYWRLRFIGSVAQNNSENSFKAAAAEITFTKGNPVVSPTPNSTFSSTNESFSPSSNAFDGDNQTYWTCAQDVALPQFIAAGYDAAHLFTSVSLVSAAGTALRAERAPSEFAVESSTDGNTWSQVAYFSGIAPWGQGESRTFSW